MKRSCLSLICILWNLHFIIKIFCLDLFYFYVPFIIYIDNFSHLPDNQYSCVESINCHHFFFQASDEKLAIEMSQIGEADVKAEPEEFCDENDDQANCSGTMWIIL